MTESPLTIAEEFLLATRYGDPTAQFLDALEAVTEDTLLDALDTDQKRLAFWINLYNAVTQHALAADPAQYENKRKFFGKPLVTVAGKRLSLDDIEHGILRRSYSKLTLGYLRSPFRDEFCERHQLDERDPRIHFAVNCGAESCAPIAAYDAENIDEQLDWATEGYLETHIEYDPDARRVTVPRVMGWFRGDWGRKRDIVAFLARYEQIPPGIRPRLSYGSWDWSLNRGEFADPENPARE